MEAAAKVVPPDFRFDVDFNGFADVMADNAVLYIGHSESLYRVSDRFKLLGHTVYEKAR